MTTRKFTVERRFENAWVLYRRIFNPLFGWTEHPAVFFDSKRAAWEAGRQWKREGGTTCD